MKKQQGFTLIELIVVIVILGILAVTAAPKFIDIQGDAKVATLKGLAGSINGANEIIHAKSVIDGHAGLRTTNANAEVGDVDTNFGYISGDSKDIVAALNINPDDWVWDPSIEGGNGSAKNVDVTIRPKGESGTSNCKIIYHHATESDGTGDPTITFGSGADGDPLDASDC